MTRRLPELVDLEIDQIGRPRREMAAQLARLPEWFRYFGAVARTHEDTVPPFAGNYLNYTRRVPLGVVGHVTPWNHPLLILTKKVAPSMAAGNTMVVKPSELAPITPLLLGEMLRKPAFPMASTTSCRASVHAPAPALVVASGHPQDRPDRRHRNRQGGRRIAGRNLTRVAAELGGKAAVIVFPDTAIDRAVAATLFAAFIASGPDLHAGRAPAGAPLDPR